MTSAQIVAPDLTALTKVANWLGNLPALVKTLRGDEQAVYEGILEAFVEAGAEPTRSAEVLRSLLGRAEPPISTDGPHEISTTRKWLARQLLDSMLSEKEALGVVAYSPALEGVRPLEPVAISPEEIAAFLVEQQDEPDPFGDMGMRGRYWRDKCITAGQRLDPKRWGPR